MNRGITDFAVIALVVIGVFAGIGGLVVVAATDNIAVIEARELGRRAAIVGSPADANPFTGRSPKEARNFFEGWLEEVEQFQSGPVSP